MYTGVVEDVMDAAEAKAASARDRLVPHLVHAALAGAYVALGIVLIFAVGAPFAAAKSPATTLVMASIFGGALGLVIFAGSDLFTGNALVAPLGVFGRRIGWGDAGRIWLLSYLGNLAGAALVAALVAGAGTFASDPGLSWVLTVAGKKMHAGFWPLFFRGALCNWLVVLAVWCSFRLKSEAAKLVMIFWCLLAFVGSGFEHSVANMGLLTLANLLPHPATISWAGELRNLIPVTLGNLASGALLVAGPYWLASAPRRQARVPVTTLGEAAAD